MTPRTETDGAAVARPAAAPAPGGASPLALARAAIHVMRPHQWSKNVLVLVPAIAGHRTDLGTFQDALVALAAFSAAASAVYVLNDVVDVESDRLHHRKSRRPFASGALPLKAGFVMIPLLLAVAAVLSALLPPAFGLVLAGYFAANLVYSFVLKQRIVADVLLLAGLYTARIFAGGFATEVPVSEWLASFSMFLFLSLALVKRESELSRARGGLPGRGYRPEDRETVLAMGTAAGYLSVLVLALYDASADVRHLYARPAWLWALPPLVLYWVSRVWVRARRGEVDGDPVVFALFDRATWVVGALGAVAVYLGT